MSSVALTSAMSGVAPTVRPKDPLEKLLPGPLSSYREFPPIDEIALLHRGLRQRRSSRTRWRLSRRSRPKAARSVFETSEERDSSELDGSAGGYGFQARMPLKDMAPGLYVLARRGHRARRRSADGVDGNRVPRRAGAGGEAMTALLLAIALVTAMQGSAIETIVRDKMSNVDDAQQAVARTPAEWAALWRLHAGDQPAPKVDFANANRGRGVSRARGRSAGYAVEIVRHAAGRARR